MSLSPLSALALSPNTDSNFTQRRPADEDGYRTWLRYDVVDDRSLLDSYKRVANSVFVAGASNTNSIVRQELTSALTGLLGCPVGSTSEIKAFSVVVLSNESPLLNRFSVGSELAKLGPDGYVIRSIRDRDKNITLIAGNSEVGTLYGAFGFLRLLQTHQSIDALDIVDSPRNALRILAHSENRTGDIDRGYSGKSLWQWDQLPSKVNPRLRDYARVNASVGINGVIINKVEADPQYLSKESLLKIAAMADLFRPYGTKVYISVNFGSPKVLGGVSTDDPLDASVVQWWQTKSEEIYKLIPDFGGFEVKANSEGLPGPEDYGRTHADGANMLGAALAPHKGIVLYRAFVYDYKNKNVNEDRVKRAYLGFQPLDGKFADNVLVQVKNGPLDFQPREPFHPLFGAMPKTRMLAELQLNQEYLGQSTHLVYLGTMWQEFLQSNTFSNGADYSVADAIEGGPKRGANGFAATSNTGDERNWTGHHFGQANWFVYGRMAWNPNLTASNIASDWIKMTWSCNPEVIEPVHKLMMVSHEAYVSYTMPLGLHHMVGGDHYAPLPEGEGDPRGIFHHASTDGIGYDRTRQGSDAVDEYHHPLSDSFNDARTCPLKFLLWFHHLPWDYRMGSGRTLFQELCFKYESGAKTTRQMELIWRSLGPFIDSQRHAEVETRLHKQADDAQRWSEHCIGYFQQFQKK